MLFNNTLLKPTFVLHIKQYSLLYMWYMNLQLGLGVFLPHKCT